jgi:hypothetical protein
LADTWAVNLANVAQSLVPGEQVVATGVFQAGGSLTARAAGFGEFSVRRREREVRDTSGIPFKRYMLLVLTPTRLYVFDARSHLGRWRGGKLLAGWDRASVRAVVAPKSVTTRLTLDVPSENRRLELEAAKTRRATAGEVARLLAGDIPPRADWVEPTTSAGLSLPAAVGSDVARESHTRAGILAIAGGLIRLLAYALPWVVVARSSGGAHVDISGYRELGSPVISLGYSIAIVVVGALYLAGRREAGPRLLFGFGISSIIVFVIQSSHVFSDMTHARATFASRGLSLTVSTGFGLWVELVGAIVALAAGLYAIRLSKAHASPPSPVRPASSTGGSFFASSP